MLSPANPIKIQASIRSLTTISTPHLGSPVADLINHPELLSPFPNLPFALIKSPLQPPLDALGISLDGLRDLTTQSCNAFSAKYLNHPLVAYFSVAGSGRPSFPQTAGAFWPFYAYLWSHSGQANDGLVTVGSAKWGAFDPNTWPCDHGEEVGNNIDNLLLPPSLPWLAKYDGLVANVAAL